MTITSVSANWSTGDYLPSLPASAPALGDIGSGALPITIYPERAIAGLYQLAASATGYAGQSVGIDISDGNVAQNVLISP